MKKITGMALSASLAISLALPATAGAQSSFSDIGENFWAKDAINQLGESGVVTGYDNGEFRPNEDITRGQAALMLAEAMDLNTEDRPDPGFTDVDSDDDKYASIAAIADEGIITGYDDEFKSNEPLTRAQMAKVLAEAYDLSGNGESDFSDISTDYWAYDHIDALVANGIATGYEDDSYRPSETTTRAQFATFIDNSMDNDSSPDPTPEEPESNEEIVTLLDDIIAQQQELDTYTFDGTVGITMDLPVPEDLSEEEQAMMEESTNMEMGLRGAFQKDPMVMETIIEQDIPQFDETINNVSLTTEDSSYEYVTDAAFSGYPEEWQDKYIEMNYEDILGEEASTDLYDMDQQQEMVEEIYDVLLENFGTQYFELQASHEAIPDDVDYEQVLSFELSQEDLSEVMTILEEDVIPELEPIFENPEAAVPAVNALTSSFHGLDDDAETIEDVPSEADIEELLENLNLENFEMHQAINADNNIVYDVGDIEVSYSDDQGDMSFGLNYEVASSNFNEDISFEYGLPESDEDIVTYDELMEWQEEQMAEFEDIEDIENMEDIEEVDEGQTE
ncbi:S-layer homology domain-containing protein [Salibacterium salarium]|uniref:S-layer homology domain-containing protein n=1 Tax=Salibacterium salarium TaxID=284579 RepID=A0A3R9WMI5_9BACI|nr:S-layer homology domain-containing protein [Salibacterium salarium]RSL29558.1 S-layer homology domain-containing protein [Salibacterium salarium]